MNRLYHWIMHIIKQPKQQGFTMLELSISLGIVSLLATGGLAILTTKDEGTRIDTTNDRLKVVQQALQLYVDRNGFLPCPATPTLAESNISFGVASAYNAGTHLCPEDPGALPVRTLGIPNEYAYDGWERKFTYRVASGMGNLADFNTQAYTGNLSIVDLKGREKTTAFLGSKGFKQGAAYVIISHGADGTGAWLKNIATAPSNATGRELENTDHAANTIYIQDQGSDIFNDIVVYARKNDLTPPLKEEAPFYIEEQTCHNVESILDDGEPTAGTNDLGNFANVNAAYVPIADQAYETAKIISKFCDNQEKPFLPSDIPGLTLWYDATDIDGDGDTTDNPANNAPIDQWRDKSLVGAHVYHEGVANRRPTYITNALNGMPALRFDGSNDYLIGHTDKPIDITTGGASFFYVGKNRVRSNWNGPFSLRRSMTVHADLEIFWQAGASNSGNIFWAANRAGSFSQYTRSNAPPNIDTYAIFTFRTPNENPSNGTLHINGTNYSIGPLANPNVLPDQASYPAIGIGYGNAIASSMLHDGDINEIILYNQPLTDANIKKVERYLSDKWGIAIQ